MDKKNILTYEGLKKLEDELENLKVVRRKEVSQKIKEAREQGDLSENAEYDAAKDEQRDIEARIEELEKILKSDDDAVFDKEVRFDAADIQPMITYGTNPGMGMGITEHIPVDHKSASFSLSLKR